MQRITLLGKLVRPFVGVDEGFVTVDRGKILAVGFGELSSQEKGLNEEWGTVVDFSDYYISPGFIDNHVHGGGGADCAEGTVEALRVITDFHARGGTTTLLPTLVPLERDRLVQRLHQLARALKDGAPYRTHLAGIHLEGPFLNPRRKGAIDEGSLAEPDHLLFDEFLQASSGQLKMITLAPELGGAEQIIKKAVEHGIVVSAGHTEVTSAVLRQAQSHGLTNVTHFYNAMSGLHHREPGAVGGALLCDGLNLDLIPDEYHVHPEAFEIAWHQKGPESISIITDCASPGGMPDGVYRLGDKTITVIDGVARLPDNTLAGSTITMIQGVQYLVEKVGLNLADAIGLATVNPARVLGVEGRKGILQTGADADLTIFKGNFEVVQTMISGAFTDLV